MSDPKRPGLAETIAALISAAAMTWVMMPAQERYWLRLSVLTRAHQLAGRLARRAGHKGMGDELAGRDYQRYGLAWWLSAARDQLAAAIEDGRP